MTDSLRLLKLSGFRNDNSHRIEQTNTRLVLLMTYIELDFDLDVT